MAAQLPQGSSGSGGSDSSISREEALKSLAAAYNTFMELKPKGSLAEGIKFYNDITQLLVNFQNKVNYFCFARETEKEELLRDLSSSVSTVGSLKSKDEESVCTNCKVLKSKCLSGQEVRYIRPQSEQVFNLIGLLPRLNFVA